MSSKVSWFHEPVSDDWERYEIDVPTASGQSTFGFTVPPNADGEPDFGLLEARFTAALEALEEAKADWTMRRVNAVRFAAKAAMRQTPADTKARKARDKARKASS